MKNNTTKAFNRTQRISLYVIFVLLFVVAMQYTLFSVLSVRNRIKFINDQEDVRLLTGHEEESDSTWLWLYRKKSWLETRAQIAMTDSISLSVNLSDSTWQIELKGVVLSKSKILDFKADRFFYQLSPGAYHHLLGSQAQADTVFSTIPKAPFIIKKAPKDSAEVDDKLTMIDTTNVEAVHWILKLDNNTVLKIEGIHPASRSGWAGRQFWVSQRLKETARALAQTLLFKVPEYSPEIRLEVNDADAKAFYRALPVHPLICIRL